MNKEDRITYEGFIIAFSKAPKLVYTLYDKAEDEIERLNNIINRIDSFVDRTIEVIKQQPTGDDEWILERLNGIKYLIELKDSD